MSSVYGPFFTVKGYPYDGNKREFLLKYAYKQKPVTRTPLPYAIAYAERLKRYGTGTYLTANNCWAYQAATNQIPSFFGQFDSAALNKCYGYLLDKVRKQIQNGENLTQAAKSADMIVRRCGEILSAYRALRKGQFGVFLDTLSTAASEAGKFDRPLQKRSHRGLRDGRRVAREASSLWLEYHFGWSPLLQDIYDAVEVLTQVPPLDKVEASAKYLRYYSSNDWPGRSLVDGWFKYRYRMGCYVQVEDPFIWQLNTLGLANPAVTAWQSLPLSFLVDWFVNVEQILSSISDFAGVSVRDAYTTRYRRAYAREAIWNSDNNDDSFAAFEVLRTTSIERPVLAFKLVKGLGASRGATAVSLVVQFFLPGKSTLVV